MTAKKTYVIVGAGVFGASTALHLAMSVPQATVILIDTASSPCPSAASSDLNKIVRADYADILYMKIALEAVDKWRNDKLYAPWYHESGMLVADEVNMGRGSFENYKKLGVDTGAVFISREEAHAKFPVFKDSNWTDVDEMFYNPRSGWAEADRAVRAVAHAAIEAGVRFMQATVTSLLFDEAGNCEGVTTETGDNVEGDFILLCSGARTARLLADSAPHRDDMQVKNRMTAAGATSCIVKCDPEHQHLYQGAPVHILAKHHTNGENVPMDKSGRLKFNLEVSYTNNEYHEASGQTISVPPIPVSQSTWSHDVPSKLKELVTRVVHHIYGKDAPGLRIELFRMCWDAVTPDQDWIISPHPSCKRLYIAAGGSFHSWKFLPVLGKYITQMLHGELAEEYGRKWAWDRPKGGSACEMYTPQFDLKDIPGYEDLKGH